MAIDPSLHPNTAYETPTQVKLKQNPAYESVCNPPANPPANPPINPAGILAMENLCIIYDIMFSTRSYL